MRNRVVAMRRKSIVQHFDKLCNTRSSKPKEFWNSARPPMHTRKQDGNSYITLKDDNKIIKEQHKSFSRLFVGLSLLNLKCLSSSQGICIFL